MFEINEEDCSIEIKECLTWEGSVLPRLECIKEEIQNIYDINKEDSDDMTEEDLENCKNALDAIEAGLGQREKVTILCEIINYFEQVTYREDIEVSIFAQDIIEEGIYRFIEEEFYFDARR